MEAKTTVIWKQPGENWDGPARLDGWINREMQQKLDRETEEEVEVEVEVEVELKWEDGRWKMEEGG
ncbi:hypothetical protein WAI453_010883 [Rhynchosporium graminicola]